MLEETRPDHAIRSSVAITKLPSRQPQEEEQQQKGEMRFFENIFSLDVLTFWLSYSTYSIITSSGTQQIIFMEKFGVKAGISCRFICISLIDTGWSTLNREC